MVEQGSVFFKQIKFGEAVLAIRKHFHPGRRKRCRPRGPGNNIRISKIKVQSCGSLRGAYSWFVAREASVEACGILAGSDGKIEELYKMINVDKKQGPRYNGVERAV